MGNIPFLCFPAFASVTRYEHSLGVCYLAQVAAESIGMCDRDRTELMLAGLYHDVATPGFAHAVEEVLEDLFGFDHETKLRDLVEGKTLGGRRAQVFLGRSLKLHSVCQSALGRRLGLDAYRIADIAVGGGNTPTSDLICSKGIDIDNIDNVFRAATAMGVKASPSSPIGIAASFRGWQGRHVIDESAKGYLNQWRRTRASLYGMIYASVDDFAVQTMVKDAIHMLADAKDINVRLTEDDWCLTDEQLIHERMMRYPASQAVITRVRLRDLYKCLAYVWVWGEHVTDHLREVLTTAEDIARQLYFEYIESTLERKSNQTLADFEEKLSRISEKVRIVSNYYIDKRERAISNRLLLFDGGFDQKPSDEHTSVMIGIFTPLKDKWSKAHASLFSRRLQFECPYVDSVRGVSVIYSDFPDVAVDGGDCND